MYILAFILLLFILLLIVSPYQYRQRVNLGNDFFYDGTQKHILGVVDIPPRVLEYNLNDEYIIVKQLPKKFHEAIYDDKEYIYLNGRDKLYYWIIDKKNQDVIGPLDSLEFDKLLVEKEITLNFKE